MDKLKSELALRFIELQIEEIRSIELLELDGHDRAADSNSKAFNPNQGEI